MTVFRRTVLVLALMLASLGVSLAAATPANASIWIQVEPNVACRQMFPGSIGASLFAWSPDGIYCYGASVGVGTSGIGAELGLTGYLDKGKIYWYCKGKYGKTYDAKVGPGWRNPLNSWHCVSSSW